MNIGYVYILSNPAMPGYFKIGSTQKTVEERAQELSISTGVPLPFEIEHWYLTCNPESVEKSVHEELSEYRVAKNREFFLVDLEVAIRVIEELVIEVQPTYTREAPEPTNLIEDETAQQKRKQTQRVYFWCERCRRSASVTLQNPEQGSVCPECHRWIDIDVKW